MNEELNESFETLFCEGLRLIKTHTLGRHTAKVYRNPDYNEWQVKYHTDGKHNEAADSFHNDLDDAHGTANLELKRMHEHLHEDGGTVSALPANNAGGGQVAGIGQGAQGEPGVDLKKKKARDKVLMVKGILKRAEPNRQAERRAQPYWSKD